MFILQLNPMTSNAENVVPIARADTEQELIDFMEGQLVDPYTDDNRWQKCFRKGGPLEWYNYPLGGTAWIGVPAIIDVGTEDTWAEEARISFRRNVIEGIVDVQSL